MIIQNGTIELRNKTAGGINRETGHPVKPSEVSWGTPIPCQFLQNTHNYLGITSGEHFTQATYTILIEEQTIEGEQLRLKDMGGKVIGEFSVKAIEPLEAVCEIKILV